MVLGGGRTDPEAPKHFGITLFFVPLDQPNITIKPIWTMGDERTNEVYLDDVWVSDDYVVGELNKGFQYISEALDLERFTMFTFSPIQQRLELLQEYVRTTVRDGVPLCDDPVIRQRVARLATEAEVARTMGLRFVYESSGEARPRRPGPRSTSSTPPSSPSGWPTPPWTSPAPGPSCGSRPRRPPWRGGPSRPIATR